MSAISAIYDATFKGIHFLELFDGAYGVEPDAEQALVAIRIPGSGTSGRTVIQDTGPILPQLELPIATDAAAIASLKAARGTSGSLIYHAGTRTARLQKVSNVRKLRQNDICKATLSFYLT